MRGLLLALLLALPLTLGACDSNLAVALRYTLLLNDALGGAAGTGELRFDQRPQNGMSNVTGQFTLQQTAGGAFPPLPQSSGTFSGEFQGGVLVVQIFAPATADIGIRLEGGISGSQYSGTWSELTIAGPQPRGTFTATATGGSGY